MTDHLKMHSLNKIDENIAKIAQLFPNCVTEAKGENGEITKNIDFDMLKQELSHSLVEGREERYQFTWPDKKQAILTANAPTNKTLRPRREESVNFDETENLYIEGDNYAKPFVQTFFSKNNELSSHRFCLQSVCYQTCFVNFIRSFVAQPLMNPFTIEELYKFPETFSQFLCT